MQVRIESNWQTQGHSIWFYERSPLRVLRLRDEQFPVMETFPDGADAPPTFNLPQGALEALLAEAEKVIPASHATERHLLDTIGVRERLLALVEKLTDDQPDQVILAERATR